MKKTQFTEEQILGILKQVEGGRRIADACREHGISDATYHHWKLDDARATIATWRDDDNTLRPHSARGNLTPIAFAHRLRQPEVLSA